MKEKAKRKKSICCLSKKNAKKNSHKNKTQNITAAKNSSAARSVFEKADMSDIELPYIEVSEILFYTICGFSESRFYPLLAHFDNFDGF